MHVISSGGIPLALFLLVRGYRRGSAPTVFAGWLVATWQLALGFTLGLMLAYLLAVLAVVLLLAWRRSRPSRQVLAASAAGAAVFAAMGAAPRAALPGGARRPPGVGADDSTRSRRSRGGPEMFLAAPDQSTIWGPVTEPVRDGLDFVPEQTLFPGLLVRPARGVRTLTGIAVPEAIADRAGGRCAGACRAVARVPDARPRRSLSVPRCSTSSRRAGTRSAPRAG